MGETISSNVENLNWNTVKKEKKKEKAELIQF